MMVGREGFLHYIWRYLQFETRNLKTVDGLTVSIINQGNYNRNQGPDFSAARLVVDNIEWAGNVEIHYKASEWRQHGHHSDINYNSVILHVVWIADEQIYTQSGRAVPTIELKNLVDSLLIERYRQILQAQPDPIPCAPLFNQLDKITLTSTLERALLERLERKAADIMANLKTNNFDWEETAYQTIAQNFGLKINSEPFFRLAKTTPLSILKKHSDSLFQIEALIFGQAGFIPKIARDDAYYNNLSFEYDFLACKYALERKIEPSDWKFLRLRPANFPTIRLAQFAALIKAIPNVFSFFVDKPNPENLVKTLDVAASEYWRNHYHFEKPFAKPISGRMGASFINTIIINSIAVLLIAYGKHINSRDHIDKALLLMEKIKGEQNHITDIWTNLGVKVKSAYDSQAVIELYNEYCSNKRCLECRIGNVLIKGK